VDLAGRIRAVRKAQEMSQEALARQAGMSLRAFNSLERGEAVDPHYSTLVGIAGALEVPVSELIGEEQASASPKVEVPSPLESSADDVLVEERRSLQLAAAIAERLHAVAAHLYDELPNQPGLGEWERAKNKVELQATNFTNFLDVLGEQSISKKVAQYYRAAGKPIPDEVRQLREIVAAVGKPLRESVRWVIKHDPESQLDVVDDYVEKWTSERLPELVEWEEALGVGGSRGS
jgi:transcriptional regulator with XRE-family HTH domain